MINHYTQIRNFSKRIDSLIDLQRNKKSAPRNTKGLLARQSPPMQAPEAGGQDYTKRIANYIGTIRSKRMELGKNEATE